jgi:arylsulfatase A
MQKNMNQSLYCKNIFITLMLLSFLGRAIAAERPNVVILLSDDLGVRDIGCYDGPVKTPTLDKLAASGSRFRQFYSGAAVCSPSRATLLTGRHHIRTGVYSWIYNETQKSHLLEREVTLPELLKKEGYATAHFGKWHLGLPTQKHKKPTPADHGFDYWFATDNNAMPSHKNLHNFIRNGTPVGQLEGYSCQLVADEAIRWLDGHDSSDKPFFLNVWFHEPHRPIAAPDDIVSKYGKLDDKAAIYSGTIDNTDQAIARLLNKLKEVDVNKNTLIIYASDNGSYRNDRTGGLRGKKGENWEGGIRVPGIFSWPGRIKSSRTLEEPAGIVDILPTVCGLLGINKPEGIHLDGSDLSHYLFGKSESVQRHQPMFWHLQRSRPIVAMRDGDYSLVADPDYDLSKKNMFNEASIPKIKKGKYKNFRLYNLMKDPKQERDISAEHPELLEKLKKKLLEVNSSIMSDGPNWNDAN